MSEMTMPNIANSSLKGASLMKTKLYAALAFAATLVATLVATSACWWWIYQPEEPQSLKNL